MLLLLAALSHAVEGNDLNVLVMGDWGGIPIPPWSTPAEHETAKYMGEEAAKINASFALALGDNFYENGIKTDEHDARFQHTFESVFTSSNLQGDAFFKVLAGNHVRTTFTVIITS